jgi:hypothetical protein
MKGDSFTKNHFVKQTDKKFMLPTDEAVSIQFQRLVVLQDGTKKFARATVTCDVDTWLKEIVQKFNLPLQGRWQIWDSEKKTNVPYSGGFQGDE